MGQIIFQKNGVDIKNMVLTPSDFELQPNGMMVFHSDEANTPNVERVTVNALYQALTPDGDTVGVSYRLQAVLEGLQADGTWATLVSQFTPHFKGVEQANTRRMIATSKPTAYDPGVNHIIADALGQPAVEISVEDIDIPEKIRMCVVLADVQNTSLQPLTSFELTMTGNIV